MDGMPTDIQKYQVVHVLVMHRFIKKMLDEFIYSSLHLDSDNNFVKCFCKLRDKKLGEVWCNEW